MALKDWKKVRAVKVEYGSPKKYFFRNTWTKMKNGKEYFVALGLWEHNPTTYYVEIKTRKKIIKRKLFKYKSNANRFAKLYRERN